MRIDRAAHRVTGLLGCALALGLAGQAAADPISWIGAGRSGGTTDNAWLDANNWDPAGLPTDEDDVEVDFNETSVLDPALLIGAGAVARDVSISGINKSNNRMARVAGNATFASLDIVNGGAAATGRDVFRIDNGITLTLDGGSAATPTLRTRSVSAAAGVVISNDGGLIDLAGENVFIQLEGRIATAVSITDPDAVVDFLNVDTHIHNSLTVYSTQTIQNLPQVILGGDLVAADNERLDNFSGAGLGMRQPGANITIPGATFGFVDIFNNASANSSHVLNLGGDLILDSDSVGDGTGHAVLLNRRDRATGNHARMVLHGYDLTVTSDAAIIVGDPNTPDPAQTFSQLDITGAAGRKSNVTLPGSVIVGHSGSIVGDATSALLIGGDFEIISADAARHDLSESTVLMVGERNASNPQTLEVHSADHGEGASAHTAGMAEFGIGMLIVGGFDEPTFLKLVDHHDFSDNGTPDALYLADLFIEAGSVLDLNGLNLYVNGQLVGPGSGEFGPGTIVPEPATLGLLALGLAGVAARRRRRR